MRVAFNENNLMGDKINKLTTMIGSYPCSTGSSSHFNLECIRVEDNL